MSNRLISAFWVCAFIVAGSGFAFAADMAAKMPVKAPPPALAPTAPAYTWIGCYIGGNWGDARDHIRNERTAFGGGIPIDHPEPGGFDTGHAFVAGLQAGCDYQVNQWVLGIQVQDDWGNINSTHPGPLFPTFSYNTLAKGFVTYTGRLGYTVLPQALLYFKGGGAWTKDDVSVTIPSAGFLSEFANNVNFNGWTIGGGLEWMLLPYLSLFVEYNHVDFGTKSVLFIAGPHAVGAGLPADTNAHTQSINAVLVGANLRFNWLGGKAAPALVTK
jgi:outer membrane immunogenic protein